MKDKIKTYILYLCSISALVISIISLCISAYRTENLSFDYLGFFVAILGVLTTVLIGWDIYKGISIDKLAKELKHAAPSAVCLSLAQLGMVLYNKGEYEHAIQILFNALAVHYEGYEEEMDEEPISYSISKLKEILSYLQKEKTPFCCSKSDFAACYLAAQKTGDKELIKFVESFSIKENSQLQ